MQLLLAALVSWFIAQLTKFSVRAFHGDIDPGLIYKSGGMPSAHTSTVVALAVAALTTQGYQSPVFGVAAVLAVIVVYDSLGVRRSSGEQSKMVNALLRATGDSRLVKEVVGHKPSEVLVGGGIGLVVALIMTHAHWSSNAAWLVAPPLDSERTVYLVAFTGLVVAAVVVRMVLSRWRNVRIMSQLKSAVWWGIFLPGALGLFFSMLQFQTTNAGTWRLWPLITGLSIVVVHVVLSQRLYRHARERYADEVKQLKDKRKLQRQASKKAKKAKKSRRK